MPHRVSLFALLSLAAAAAIGTPGGGAQSDTKFVGLPVTGQIDDQRVVQARYGTASTADTSGTAVDAAVQTIAASGVAGVPRDFKGGLTGVAIDSTADAGQVTVPLTFGQVFAPGDVKPSDRLVGKLADGTAVPLQVDVKARHADGSVRHALISALLPALAAHQTAMLTLAKDGAAPAVGAKTVADPRALLDRGFKACVSATIDGQAWSACADRLLAAAGKRAQSWIAGPIAQEWLVDAPLMNAQGAEHPHLAARFAVRWYAQARRARVDVSVENDWAYAPNPRNLTYDARFTVGDKAGLCTSRTDPLPPCALAQGGLVGTRARGDHPPRQRLPDRRARGAAL